MEKITVAMYILKSRATVLVLLVFCCRILSRDVFEQKYIETVGNSNIEIILSIINQPSGYYVKIQHRDKTETFTVDSNGFCSEWHYNNIANKTEYFATLNAGTLQINGRKNCKNFSSSVQLRNYPWIQFWEFGIRQMIALDKKEMRFFSVDPNNPDRVATFVVKDRGKCFVILKNSKEPVIHTTITLQGLPAAVFKADYWFRESDLTLLKSELPRGPLAPITRLELKE